MSNGLLSMRKRLVKSSLTDSSASLQPTSIRAGTYAHFNRHLSIIPDTFNVTITSHRAQKLKPVDRFLRGFRYADALDSVLQFSPEGMNSYNPDLVVALLQELLSRQALQLCLSNRDEHSLLPLLIFLSKHVTNPIYRDVCVATLEMVLGMYGGGRGMLSRSIVLESVVKRLGKVVEKEIEVCGKVSKVLGTLEGFMMQV